MRYALFADIHNNTLALEKVLGDIKQRAANQILCLGDIGNDSCVDIVRTAEIPTVFGNWEAAHWKSLSPQNSAWVLNLPPILHKEGFWVTHAGPFWPPRIKTLANLLSNHTTQNSGKLFPYLHFEEERLWETIATMADTGTPLMFHGHTHRQLGWRLTRSNKLQRIRETKIDLTPGDIFVIGIGSAGRSADGPGAAYAIFDDDAQTVEMIRVH
jgi:predicted phosphodiesterase